MASTKEKFAVLDGLNVEGDITGTGNVAIDTNVLFVDSVNNRVGVLKVPTQGSLDVDGTLHASFFSGDGASITNVDAETLDGVEGASYLRSDENTSFGLSGTPKSLTFNNSSVLQIQTAKIQLDDDQLLQFGNVSGNPDVRIRWQASNNYLSFDGGDINIRHLTETPPLFYADVSAGKIAINRNIDGINEYALDISGSLRVTGDIVATGDVTAYSSDAKLKTNIKPIDNALQKIDLINGYEYDWNIEKCKEVGFTPKNKHEHGVLAHEIEAIMPDLVVESAFDSEYKSVKYDRIVPLLIAAIKELQKEIQNLKK
jgi:hypothetical protein